MRHQALVVMSCGKVTDKEADQYLIVELGGWCREVNPIAMPLKLRVPFADEPVTFVLLFAEVHQLRAASSARAFWRQIHVMFAHGCLNRTRQSVV